MSTDDSVVVEEDRLPNFYNYLHRHKEMQVTLIIKGSGTLIAGNYTQPFEPGNIYIMGANQPHIFKSDPSHFANNKKDNAHAVHIFFDHDRILKNLLHLQEMEHIKKFLDRTHSGLQVIDTKLQAQLAPLVMKVSAGSGFERLINFFQLLQYFSKDVKEWKSLSTGFSKYSFTDSEGIRMNDIYQYTMDHYNENITLKQIAAVAHITPHAFCKYFKKHTRKTYMAFLNEIRINEACKKIINGEFTSIAGIAYAMGFNSAINFNRVFKKTTGLSPSEYIRSFKTK
ncbi:AraC-like DNA-binding protein [Chitinophaga skermanii]|uniref:AraC-like DNA-binding protein n=1 Tax=Chitinophaga skermanii TaxID=331697 RepID=A0A327QM25_9BACT|nr:AraC family transcriptional regulator [Chitinophaga skermanii]RAJ05311.1 AraC-like DNA-binding protein [Chitinophaga skermanii]